MSAKDVGSTDTPITSPDQEAIAITRPSGQPTAAELFAAIDWDARLQETVRKTLNARLARLDTRNALAEARNHGLAARHAIKENRGPTRTYLGSSDTVSNPCHQPATPQVNATQPVTKTGEIPPGRNERSPR